MFLNRKACLALTILTAIAHHSKAGLKVTSTALIQHYQLSERALESLLQKLSKAGYIRSYRGKYGGYECISPETITVAEIIQGYLSENFLEPEFHIFEPVLQTFLFPPEKHMLAQLKKVTLADLARQAENQNIPHVTEPVLDYAI